MSTTTHERRAVIGLAAAGLLMATGGILHPHADSGAGYEEALAGMFETSAWTASHAMTLLGFLLLALSAATLVRDLGHGWPSGLRLAGLGRRCRGGPRRGRVRAASVRLLRGGCTAERRGDAADRRARNARCCRDAGARPVGRRARASQRPRPCARQRAHRRGRWPWSAGWPTRSPGRSCSSPRTRPSHRCSPGRRPLRSGSSSPGVRTARRQREDVAAGQLDVVAAR